MKKCLLWGMGHCLFENINLLKYHEMSEHFQVVGVTATSSIYSEMGGYRYIDKNEIGMLEFDFVIVFTYITDTLHVLFKDIAKCGIKDEIVFTHNILKHPSFNIGNFLELKKNPPSIIANNCWGGFTYHNVGMPFNSPFINTFVCENDYMRMLKNLRYYMNEELEFAEIEYNEYFKKSYPVARCGDIRIKFVHETSFEKAVTCWEKRKKRINWDNLFVMMCTENRETAAEFSKLSYKKKMCFVPFIAKEESLLFIDFVKEKEIKGLGFGTIVNGMANGAYPYYDPFELLLNGRITKLV